MTLRASSAHHEPLLRMLRAIAGGDTFAPKSAARAALLLEEQFLVNGWPVGEVVASVDDLRERLRIGRWVCREALGILQVRCSAFVRRGPGGGLVVSIPSFEKIAYSLYVHFVLAGATVGDVFQARNAIYAATSRMCVEAGVCAESLAQIARIGDEHYSFPLRLATLLNDSWLIFFIQLLETLCNLAVGAGHYGHERVQRGINLATKQDERTLIAAIAARDVRRVGELAWRLAPQTAVNAAEPSMLTLPVSPPEQRVPDVGYAGEAAARMAIDLSRIDAANGRLGTEHDIAARYGFHPEIIRQAVRILEGLSLVQAQRGRGRGVVRQKPLPGPAIRLLFSYLAGLSPTVGRSFAFLSHLACEASALAAQSRNPLPVALYAEWMTQLSDATQLLDAHKVAEIEHRMLNTLVNPVLTVCLQSLAFHHQWSAGRVPNMRSVGGEYCSTTRDMLEAIMSCDVSGAHQAQEAKNSVLKKLLPV